MKELRIPFNLIQNHKTISKDMEHIFKKNDLDIRYNGVKELIDDYGRSERILKVETRKKYFFME